MGRNTTAIGYAHVAPDNLAPDLERQALRGHGMRAGSQGTADAAHLECSGIGPQRRVRTGAGAAVASSMGRKSDLAFADRPRGRLRAGGGPQYANPIVPDGNLAVTMLDCRNLGLIGESPAGIVGALEPEASCVVNPKKLDSRE